MRVKHTRRSHTPWKRRTRSERRSLCVLAYLAFGFRSIDMLELAVALGLDSGLWTLDPGHLWRYGSRSIDTACRDCGFGFKDSGLADSRASACRERTTTLDFELFLALRVGSIDTA